MDLAGHRSVTRPFGFVCDRCERVVPRPDSPWCARCGTELGVLEPPVPRERQEQVADEGTDSDGDSDTDGDTGVTRSGKVGRALRSYGTLMATLFIAVALAFDPVGKWVVAPFVVLLVLIAGLFLAMIVAGRQELAALVRDRRTRVIHGLEHACIAILEERGQRPTSGSTRKWHFEIDRVAGTTHEDVARATREAIDRIAAGETRLAYSPRCGTSQLVALILYAVIIAAGGVTSVLFGVPLGAMMLGCAVLCVLAQLVAPWLGLLAQRMLTVSTRFRTARVGAVTVTTGPRGPRFVVPVTVH